MTKFDPQDLTNDQLKVQFQLAHQKILNNDIGKDREGIRGIINECVARRWNGSQEMGFAVRQAAALLDKRE